MMALNTVMTTYRTVASVQVQSSFNVLTKTFTFVNNQRTILFGLISKFNSGPILLCSSTDGAVGLSVFPIRLENNRGSDDADVGHK